MNLTDSSRILNFGVCLVIAIFGLFFWLSLLGKQPQDSEASLKRQPNFVFRAFACWVISWWVWVILWAFEAYFDGPYSKSVILSLSDCNTILVVLFYFGLTRGKTYELARYFIHGLLLFIVFALVLTGLYLLAGNVNTWIELHIKWSLALSMFSPLLVGWAFKLRYDTDWGSLPV